MSYEIKPVALDDPELSEQIVELLRSAFGGQVDLASLKRNTTTGAAQPSLYLAAIEDGEVIGFNAFISHELLFEVRTISCFQSCWTATSPAHRGKRIFQAIIKAAHDILKDRGAAFVFGFPNDSSYPLFTKKLGYREIPSLKWQMLHIPGLRGSWFSTDRQPDDSWKRNAIDQNDVQLIGWKRKDIGADVLVATYENSLAWGVRRVGKRRGFPIAYLDVGGISLGDSGHLSLVLVALRSMAKPTLYTQMVTVEGNGLNSLLGRVGPAETNCLIVFDLNLDTSSGVRFNFFAGIRDVYR